MSANDEVFVRSVERHEIRFAIALVLCVELLDEVHCEQFAACHRRFIRQHRNVIQQTADNQQSRNKLLHIESPL